jgi:hypothetical protein
LGAVDGSAAANLDRFDWRLGRTFRLLDVAANGVLFALVMAPMAKLQSWVPFLPFKTPHVRIRTLCLASALAFAILMAPLSRI